MACRSLKLDSTFFEHNPMNTPTPTPRTDAAWTSSFEGKQLSAGQTARALRECSQKLETELAALTAERDQLRAEVEWWCDELVAARQRETVAIASWDEERSRALREGERVVEWRDRAERAEAAETVALANWNGALERAMKAEADLAALERCHDDNCRGVVKIAAELDTEREKAERYRLVTLKQDAELATERARLDSGTILLTVAGERVWHCGVDLRAAIDAAMKENAK